MCEAVFWPPDLKLNFMVVLGYGTFDFKGDFLIHDFGHFMTQVRLHTIDNVNSIKID